VSDGFEGYDDWKLRSPEDELHRRRRPLLFCMGCGELCEGLLCDACAEEREEDGR
jgi:recombinational DNA repair protein RecR